MSLFLTFSKNLLVQKCVEDFSSKPVCVGSAFLKETVQRKHAGIFNKFYSRNNTEISAYLKHSLRFCFSDGSSFLPLQMSQSNTVLMFFVCTVCINCLCCFCKPFLCLLREGVAVLLPPGHAKGVCSHFFYLNIQTQQTTTKYLTCRYSSVRT